MTIDEIIARAGGLTKLAKIAGVDPSTIASAWRRTGRVPVVRARAVSKGLDISLADLRPDVWFTVPYQMMEPTPIPAARDEE